jgi:dTDP-glucose 4,6-dehydratase
MNFASPASPMDFPRYPIEILKVGGLGTLHTLGLARAKHARFMLASTSEAYGDPEVNPQPETYWGHVNPIGPRSVYDEAKRYAEAMTMAYHRHHGIDTRIVRIFNTYGPRMRPDDGRAIPQFITQALAGDPMTVHGDGSQTRSFCYVDDLVEGIVRLLVVEPPLHEPVNIGSPNEMTVLEMAELIKELTGSESDIKFTERPVDDPSVRRPDITRAQTLLGWNPTVDVREGLQRTLDWFRR